MKRYKRLLFICIAACSLCLGGCGDALHELTVEEEAFIVHYAAYAVAKHNIQQKDGMSGVYIPETVPEESDSPEDTQLPEDTQSPDGQGGTEDTPDMPEVDNTVITLAEAIGHGDDLVITYSGSTVTDHYVEGSAYSLDASEGKTFFVMKFSIMNTTENDVEVENVTKGLKFRLISGETSVSSESTFLMTDLSTYYGMIPAGQSVDTVLLFEVPETDAEQITEPELQILLDDVYKNVKI